MATSWLRTQGLTEGAVLAALVAVLAAASNYLPVVGVAAAYLGPLPLAVLVIRHGFRVAALASVASALVGAMLAGPFVGLAILISFAPMGIVIGLGARQRWPAGRVIGLATISAAISISVSFAIVLSGEGGIAGFIARYNQSMERALGFWTNAYGRLGLPKEQIDQLASTMGAFARMLPYLLPGILVIGAATAAWLNYEVARRVLARFRYELLALPPARTWRLPDGMVWLPLGGIALSLVAARFAIQPLQAASASIIMLSMIAFMLQGLLVEWVILGNIEFTPRERTVAVVVTFLLSSSIPIIGVVLLLLGVLDSSLKIRTRWGLRATTSGAES